MDNIAARLRPRSKWEAVDLGFALVRQWWRPMLVAWLLASLPVMLLIGGIAFLPALLAEGELRSDSAAVKVFSVSLIAVLALWWLKPLFERAPLYVLGEAMFGQVPTTRQIIKALPRLFWNNGIFASLTWRRFNLGRTFDFPIRQLEGSKGKFAAQRRRALNPYGWGAAAKSAWVLSYVELVLMFAAGLLLNSFWIGEGPFSYGVDLGGAESQLAQDIAYFGLYYVAMSFVDLFFVAIGFSLYLNARNSLEGWDIELAFRKLRARLDAPPRRVTAKVTAAVKPTAQSSASKVLAILICISIGGLFGNAVDAAQINDAQTAGYALQKAEIRASSGSAIADDGEHKDAVNGQSRAVRQGAVDELEGDSRMGSSVEKTRLNYIGPWWTGNEAVAKKKPPKITWLADLVGYLASAFKYLGWGALIVLITYLIYRALKNAGWLQLQRARVPLPDTLFGMDVRPESLPDDVPASAREYLQKGDVRAALALIYRASLIFLLQDGKIEIANGDTEGDCLRRVRAGYMEHPSFGAMMRTLFNAWLWVAYKRAPLAVAECEQLIANWQAEMQFMRATNAAQAADGGARG